MILAPFVNYNMGAKIPVSAEAAQNNLPVPIRAGEKKAAS
jgi:hypothetical protein